MRVFVTGGAGFIGNLLCRELCRAGHTVIAFDNLSTGRKELLGSLESGELSFVRGDLLLDNLAPLLNGIDLVFHLAANSDIAAGIARPEIDEQQSVVATSRLLKAMANQNVHRIVFTSTSAVYGEASIKPTPEDYVPLNPISHYGAAKLKAERLIQHAGSAGRLRGVILRLANVVGKNQTHGLLYDMHKKLSVDKLELSVLGDGSQKKSFLHVEDCVSGLLKALSVLDDRIQLFNLTSDGITSVREVVEAILAHLGITTRLIYGSSDRGWPGDVPYTWMSGEKFKSTGWRPRFNSGDAVHAAIREVFA